MALINKNKPKQDLVREIENALESVNFGSIEIIVQDSKVTQISVRNIKKTSIDIADNVHQSGTEEVDRKIFTIQARFRRSE